MFARHVISVLIISGSSFAWGQVANFGIQKTELRSEQTKQMWPWSLNNSDVSLNTNVNPGNNFYTGITWGEATNSIGYTLSFTNSNYSPGTINFATSARLNDSADLIGANLPITDDIRAGVSVVGTGARRSVGGTQGPVISANLDGTVGFSFDGASGSTATANPRGLIELVSLGASGSSGVYDGADGGFVHISSQALTIPRITGTLSARTDPSVPWRPSGVVTSAISRGGIGTFYENSHGFVTGGKGGDGGPVSAYVAFYANVSIDDLQAASPFATFLYLSEGGHGASESGYRGTGSPNGNGGNITVEMKNQTIRANSVTSGYLYGLVAASAGGASNMSEADSRLQAARTGSGGDVSVSLDHTGIDLLHDSIDSIGLVATSSGNPAVLNGHSVSDASGATFGAVDVTLTPTVAIYTTRAGVIANSVPNWSVDPLTGEHLGSELAAGRAGRVTVRNDAQLISVDGDAVVGVMMQSIGGSRVVSTASDDTSLFVGDAGGSGGSGAAVSYTATSGRISVDGTDAAVGILAQSIGGGGGNGGNTKGLFVSVGGRGGAGGSGGTVDLDLINHSIDTFGDFAKGILAQSIGAGGGHGGSATAYGAFIDAGIGGQGGVGGEGGAITVSLKGVSEVYTSGQHSTGITLQSIGGGGGTGGAAQSAEVGVGITVNVAVGGQGAGGGAGGSIDLAVDSSSVITTKGHDAHGVLLQSISGGGGVGGSSSGKSYNIGSIPDVPLKLNLGIAVGGSGGSAKTPADITVNNDGMIHTSGDHSYGLVAQSVGGGGGHGADSIAGTNSWGNFGDAVEDSFNFAMAIGGSGGAAGDGGAITLSTSGEILTQGHHAVGVLAHSVGGGGGSGGAGNAYETTRWVNVQGANEQSLSLKVGGTIGDGGSAASSGNGGAIWVAARQTHGAGIMTIGAGAVGLFAQSVGGGGGMGGDAGTQGIGGQTVSVEVGGDGSGGGNGDSVTVNFSGAIQTGGMAKLGYTASDGNTAYTSPVTIGGSSHGIVAQSIGGGGGVGGNADPSTSLVSGLTKFIASWDPLEKVLNIKEGIEFWAKRVVYDKADKEWPTFSMSYSGSLSVGGAGGTGGDGGPVSVTLNGTSDITTYGHHSYAIMAQSIGGGGGVGGTATSNSVLSTDISLKKLASEADVAFTLSVGGSGGASGSGEPVTVIIDNPYADMFVAPGRSGMLNNEDKGNLIRTGGYASHAVLAQSIGGGGGAGHEGSILGLSSIQGWQTPKATLGATSSSAVDAGGGGRVTVGTSDRPVTGYIETAGDAASLVLAQSIGGGGGTISFGCTTNGRGGNNFIRHSTCFTDAQGGWTGDASTYSAPKFINTEQKFDLAIQGGLGGSAVLVQVYLGKSHLVTDGDRAIGIVAQSIGGGGGYISADGLQVGEVSLTQSDPTHMANGGPVSIQLSEGAYLATYGAGAWGVLAQSIGGGGGLLGDSNQSIVTVPSAPTSGTAVDSWYGEPRSIKIVVTDASQVHTHGTNAHAIVAQSWAGGGGIFGSEGSLVLGNAVGQQATQSRSNFVTLDRTQIENDENYFWGAELIRIRVDSTARVMADGRGAIAILAQSNSSSRDVNEDPLTTLRVTVAGLVQGGTTHVDSSGRTVEGVGIMFSGGTQSNDRGFGNEVIVSQGGSLTTIGGTSSGYAIMTDYGVTNVTNEGVVTGSVDLGSTPGTFTNQSSGVINAGAVYKVGHNSLHNYGTFNIGDDGSIATTGLDGRFVQYESGRLIVDVDLNDARLNDRLTVTGVARIDGEIVPQTRSLLPMSFDFLTAGSLELIGQIRDAHVFDWELTVSGNTLSKSVTADFTPDAYAMTGNQGSLANYLQTLWDRSSTDHATLFGYIHEFDQGDHSSYQAALNQITGQVLNSQPIEMKTAFAISLSDSLSCPIVTDEGLKLNQTDCAWARVTGSIGEQSANSSNSGYHVTAGGIRLGAQKALRDQWTTGFSLGYANNYLTSTGFTSNGSFFDASLSAQKKVNDWSLGASLGMAYGWFDNNRALNLGANGAAAAMSDSFTSSSDMMMVGLRLRAAYEYEQKDYFIKPYVDLDLMYSHTGGYTESGSGALALKANASNQFNVAISPMVEFGADLVTDGKRRIKAYVSGGATFMPSNNVTTPMAFANGLAGAGTYDVITDGPEILGRLNLGIQAFEANDLEVRAQYGLQVGDGYLSQSLSASVTWRF